MLNMYKNGIYQMQYTGIYTERKQMCHTSYHSTAQVAHRKHLDSYHCTIYKVIHRILEAQSPAMQWFQENTTILNHPHECSFILTIYLLPNNPPYWTTERSREQTRWNKWWLRGDTRRAVYTSVSTGQCLIFYLCVAMSDHERLHDYKISQTKV